MSVTPTAAPRGSLAARLLMAPIRGWRLVSRRLPPRCRFYPSCSAYALESLARHGAARGSWLALRRVGRCHPWHAGGLDPVPTATERRRESNIRSPERPEPAQPARAGRDEARLLR